MLLFIPILNALFFLCIDTADMFSSVCKHNTIRDNLRGQIASGFPVLFIITMDNLLEKQSVIINAISKAEEH